MFIGPLTLYSNLIPERYGGVNGVVVIIVFRKIQLLSPTTGVPVSGCDWQTRAYTPVAVQTSINVFPSTLQRNVPSKTIPSSPVLIIRLSVISLSAQAPINCPWHPTTIPNATQSVIVFPRIEHSLTLPAIAIAPVSSPTPKVWPSI